MLDAQHRLKLLDFGFATHFEPGQQFTDFVGSPDYAAPEIVAAVPYQGPLVDVWAAGCVLFILSTSYLPFATADRIRSLSWAFPPGSTPSQPLLNLLEGIFQPPETRATMAQLLVHEWALDEANPIAVPTSMTELEVDQSVVDDMVEHYGWSKDEIHELLSAKVPKLHSQIVTTYSLLKHRKDHTDDSKPQAVWGQGGDKKKCALM